MSVQETRYEAGCLVKRAAAVIAAAKSAARDLTPAEVSQVDSLHAQVDSLLRSAELMEGFTTPMGERTRTVPPDGNITPDVKEKGWDPLLDMPILGDGRIPILRSHQKFSDLPLTGPGADAKPGELSLSKVILGMATGDWTGASEERSIMIEGTGSLGGFLVPPVMTRNVLDMARNLTCCIPAGGLSFPIGPEAKLVKVTQDPVAGFAAEAEAVPESNLVFGPVNMKAQVLGVTIELTEELIRDAVGTVGSVETAISKALALKLDLAALMGTGVNEPRGLYYTAGVHAQLMHANGSIPTYAKVSAAIHDVLTDNGNPGALIWSPRTAFFFDTSLAGDQQPLLPPPSVAALRKFTTNQIPNTLVKGSSGAVCSAIFVGDWSALAFGFCQDLRFSTSESGKAGNFAKRIITLRGYLRADVAVLRPEFFSIVTGVKAS